MSLKIVKYIKVDDEKGILYSAGKESLLIPVTFIKSLDEVFVELVGREGADILIYKIGEALGREYVSTLDTILKKEKTIISSETKLKINCNAICMEAGWGRSKVLKIDLERDLLEIEVKNTPSRRFFEKSRYNLERGLIAGIYQKITQKEIYCDLIKEDRKKDIAVLAVKKEIPEEIQAKERFVLLTRRDLERKIKESQKQLKERIRELQKFHEITIGRELRMVELKEEIEKLKKKLREKEEGKKDVSI